MNRRDAIRAAINAGLGVADGYRYIDDAAFEAAFRERGIRLAPLERAMTDAPDMVEHVARALCLADGLSPVDRLEAGGETIWRWEAYTPRARAAIEAYEAWKPGGKAKP